MIKPEQVPKGSAKAVHELFEPGYLESIGLHPEAIIAAALNAWPGGEHKFTVVGIDAKRKRVFASSTLIFPLPQETRDDQ